MAFSRSHSTLRRGAPHLFRIRAAFAVCGGGARSAEVIQVMKVAPAGSRIVIRGVQRRMRLSALLVTAIGLATPALAQQTQASPPAQTASPRQDAQAADANKHAADLPVSLDRIREALQQPAAEPLKIRALDEKPQFRVEVNE